MTAKRPQFGAPFGYGFTLQDQGSDDTVDSDPDANGLTSTFSLAANENKDDIDAGLLSESCSPPPGSTGPHAVDDFYEIFFDEPDSVVTLPVLANDYDVPLTIVGVSTTAENAFVTID